MIELNLLPRELRAKKSSSGESGLPVPALPLAAGMVFLALMLSFAVVVSGFVRSRSLRELDKEWRVLEPRKQHFDKLSAEVGRMENAVEFISRKADPSVDWAGLLGGLSEAVTPGVWLSRLNVEGPGDPPSRLIISGYALGRSEIATAGVGRFITSLKSVEGFAKYFTEIELLDMRSQIVSGAETMMFRLRCDFEKAEEEKPSLPAPGRRAR